jgi:meckelin
VDILFLDWEKPRRVLANGGGREEPGPVSAWRTLLVANEWNELQTSRFTCPTFTLLTAVSRGCRQHIGLTPLVFQIV